MKNRAIKNIFAIFAAFAIPAGLLAEDGMIAQIRSDAGKFCATSDRSVGSEDARKTGDFIISTASSLPNVKVFVQEFPVIVPHTIKSEIRIGQGGFAGSHRIYPVWPDNVRLKTTPPEGISGTPIYIGKGEFQEIPGSSIRGQIAVMEMSAYGFGNWWRAFDFGATAVILLGSGEDTLSLPTDMPFYKPRFYLPEGKLADALRRGEIKNATVFCSQEWKTVNARNIITVVGKPALSASSKEGHHFLWKPVNEKTMLALTGKKDASTNPVLVIAACYDAISIVPDLSPGAYNAVNSSFLLNLLRNFSVHPPERPAVIAFVEGYGINQLGMRQLMAMLSLDPEDITRKSYEELLAKQLAEYEKASSLVDGLGKDGLGALLKLHDRKKYEILQRYVKDELSPEIINLKDETGKLRLLITKVDGEEREKAKADLAVKTARLEILNRLLCQIIINGKIDPDLNDEALKVWASLCKRVDSQLESMKNRSGYFSRLDEIRSGILKLAGLESSAKYAFPFIIGIDITDAGCNVGPALWCKHLEVNELEASREFTRWMTSFITDPAKELAGISQEQLSELGIDQGNIKSLISSFMNTEAVDGGSFERLIRSRLPTLSQEKMDIIIHKIKLSRSEGGAAGEAISNTLKDEILDLTQEEMQRLTKSVMNRQSMEDSSAPESFMPEGVGLLTSQANGFGMQGVTWSTLEGIRSRFDTPQDTFENLNWKRLEPQLRLTSIVLTSILNSRSFKAKAGEDSGWPRWRMPYGTVVGESVAGTIPKTPEAGLLVNYTNVNWWSPCNKVRGVRGMEMARTDADGTFMFPPVRIPNDWRTEWKRLNAYMLSDDGRIVRGISDINTTVVGNLSSVFSLRSRPPMKPLRAVMFEGVELEGPVIKDPRYQCQLNEYKLFDVGRGGTPKRYNFRFAFGRMTGLLQKDTRWQLIFRIGSSNRMALMNVPEDAAKGLISLREALSVGYRVDEVLPALPEEISATDFYRIDEWRLRNLESAGVVCRSIRNIHAETNEWFKKAEEARKNDDGAAIKRSASAALANEIRVYHAVQNQADDVSRGAIFLLLLLVPFSIAMERLLFASAGIGRQIVLSSTVFFLMSGLLSSFHPGFRITSQPIIILLAFSVLLLSLIVIVMVFQKFKGDMEEMQRGSLAEASGAQINRAGVIFSAIWLGIANMRKRLLRTILTGFTIVLITFSLLCFTSSSSYQDKRVTTLEKCGRQNAPGILIQHPAMRALDTEMEENIRNFLGYKYGTSGRYWIVQTNPNWRLHVRNPLTNKLAALKGGLGLYPSESKIGVISKYLPDWDKFVGGDGCYLTRNTAEQLELKPGDKVNVAGRELALIGTFDSKDFVQKGRKLDGNPLVPIDFTIEKDNGSLNQKAVEGEMASGNMFAASDAFRYASPDEIIIIPALLARKMGASLRSIAVECTAENAAQIADNLMKLLVYPVYYSTGGEVKAIVSTPLLPKAPRKLLIPIIIAALIIFNTMLNSIAERRKEIHIYSSLGLAPNHIGVLFLAEALTYGMMGSVFGYVAGQGIATVLTNFNLMGGITLNYSGSNVIMTMGLVLLVVTLSSIVPAVMAAKVASPSSDLDWRVPKPKDGVISDLLPFTVNSHASHGLVSFLFEYIDAHRDGAIGNFTSDKLVVKEGDSDGHITVEGVVWLSPYDLGVRQDFSIQIAPTGVEDICSLKIFLRREAGEERSWWRLNRVFIGDLRKQLLGWRNVSSERMLKYVAEGRMRTGKKQKAI
ncbi:MAG TPA: hypothetical protein DCZ94_16010 [Lentisphaeria bacterium]|nr:MAG: hypothetical protein A2X48_01285 [Lentisphaerae bacterium GWF2_49_21]HBC88453.1 hypothetical protein [Lentisphaeria bacterium]